jgi:hypothetical protein
LAGDGDDQIFWDTMVGDIFISGLKTASFHVVNSVPRSRVSQKYSLAFRRRSASLLPLICRYPLSCPTAFQVHPPVQLKAPN